MQGAPENVTKLEEERITPNWSVEKEKDKKTEKRKSDKGDLKETRVTRRRPFASRVRTPPEKRIKLIKTPQSTSNIVCKAQIHIGDKPFR